MAIKKYFFSKDATITNCYESNLIYRATGSNAGLSDTLQIFSIYGQATTSSQEKARIIMYVDDANILSDRTSGIIPDSGSCKFFLNLYNCPHSFSVPRDFYINVSSISDSVDWEEGNGVDDDEWGDEGWSNWVQAASSSVGGVIYWTETGSAFYTGSYDPGVEPPTYTQYFDSGLENLRIEVTSLVEEWLESTIENNGLCLYLDPDYEDSNNTYYIKKFFGRGSEYYFYRPTITVEWDDSISDDRGFFYASSSLASSTDNTNKIYFYNKVRNSLKTIPGITSSNIYIRLFDDRQSGSLLVADTDPITGGLSFTGVYTASVVLETTSSVVYDRWYNSNLGTCFYTGSISVNYPNSYGSDNQESDYFVSMPNLKSSYKTNEKPRLKVFTRNKNWSSNIYSVANQDSQFSLIKNMYYRVRRVIDHLVCIDYGTGSVETTKLSYDVSSSYFDFDMSNLDPDYSYEFSYLQKRSDDLNYEELPQCFKFRVEKNQY